MEFKRGDLLIFMRGHNETIRNGKSYQESINYFLDKPSYDCGVDVSNFEQ